MFDEEPAAGAGAAAMVVNQSAEAAQEGGKWAEMGVLAASASEQRETSKSIYPLSSPGLSA
jgi:hypothetical protein